MEDVTTLEQLAAVAGALFIGGTVAVGSMAAIMFRLFMGSWPTPRNGKAVDNKLTNIETIVTELKEDSANQWKQISQNREDIARLEGRTDVQHSS